MNIVSFIGHLLLMVSMQFGGVTELEVGEGYKFHIADQIDSPEVVYEMRLVEIPYEGYFTCEMAIYTEPETYNPDVKLIIAGTQTQNEIYVFSFKDTGGNNFFSVNDAGEPFVFLKYKMEEKYWDVKDSEFPFRNMYASTDKELCLDFKTNYANAMELIYENPGLSVSMHYNGRYYNELSFIDINLDGESFHIPVEDIRN